VNHRLEHIRIDRPINQELTSNVLRIIAGALDNVDDGLSVAIGVQDGWPVTDYDYFYAWVYAAFLIADACEIDSVTLRSMARSIFKGVQGEL